MELTEQEVENLKKFVEVGAKTIATSNNSTVEQCAMIFVTAANILNKIAPPPQPQTANE